MRIDAAFHISFHCRHAGFADYAAAPPIADIARLPLRFC